jgi:ribosomal protein L7/L12
MKIECTPQELECLQKTSELITAEKQVTESRVLLDQRLNENWELRDKVSNLQHRLNASEDQCRRLADNAARYQNQPHMDSDTRVRFLSFGNREKLDDIIGFINGGQKIAAIKAYRELTGLGLRESKDAIERRIQNW